MPLYFYTMPDDVRPMEKVKNQRLVIRFYLPVLAGILLVITALWSERVSLKEQVVLQATEEHLATFESLLFQLMEAQAGAQDLSGSLLPGFGDELLVKSLSGIKEGARLTPQLAQDLSSVQGEWEQWKSISQAPAISTKSEVLQKHLQQVQRKTASLRTQLGTAVLQQELRATIAFCSWVVLLPLLLIFTVYKIQKEFLKPLKCLKKQTAALREGIELPPPCLSENSLFYVVEKNIHEHQQQLDSLARMADDIGEGKFVDQEDFALAGVLGHSIGGMQEKIKLSFQEEERRSWSNEGIARFSAMVREGHENMEQLNNRLLSALVPFVEASQGGLFICSEEDDKLLELKASFAWGRRKHLQNTCLVGEGLVGQSAQDQDMILITDVPEDYIHIGSGLGHAKPRSVVLLPLISAEKLCGVLELASFRNFEEHQLSFLQKFCEILASAIAMSSGTHTTARLLKEAEEANQQMKAQEEELRQNTEELMATQEAMRRKEEELEVMLQEATQEMRRQIQEIESEKKKNLAILEGCVDGVISFNVDGKVEYFNKAAEEIWEVSRKEAMKRKIQDFIPVEMMMVEGELLVYYAKSGGRKLLEARTEVPVKGKSGQEMEVLLTLTRVQVEGAYTFTAFAQKVAVELF